MSYGLPDIDGRVYDADSGGCISWVQDRLGTGHLIYICAQYFMNLPDEWTREIYLEINVDHITAHIIHSTT